MSDGLQILITIGGFLLSVTATWIAVSKYYRESLREKQLQLQQIVSEKSEATKKEYAAERDFKHLERNLQQLQIGQDQIMKELELRIQKMEVTLEQTDKRLIRLSTGLSVWLKPRSKESIGEILDSLEDDR